MTLRALQRELRQRRRGTAPGAATPGLPGISVEPAAGRATAAEPAQGLLRLDEPGADGAPGIGTRPGLAPLPSAPFPAAPFPAPPFPAPPLPAAPLPAAPLPAPPLPAPPFPLESRPVLCLSPDEPLPPELAERLQAVRAAHPALHRSLAALDPAQLAAVLSDEPAVLVRAPVGSGKTTVLVHRVLYLHLCRGVPLGALSVLTFTTRAAAEIRARVLSLLGEAHPPAPGDLWLTGTFHGVARALLSRALPLARIGYRPDFTLLEDEACDELLGRLMAQHRLRLRGKRHLRRRLRAYGEGDIGLAAPARDDLARLYAVYAAEKRAQNAMDFDDLITHATALLAEAPGGLRLRGIVVDEMQDCEPRELRLLARLRGPDTQLFAVGDPHQAIYGFRGGDPVVFARAEADFGCRAYALPVNYRSTRTIVDAARVVLGLQSVSGGGALVSRRGFGERIALRRHHDPLSEALYLAERISRLRDQGVPYHEVAILFRLRAQAQVLREVLTGRGVPCVEPEDPPTDAVRLLTLHAAKGLEFRQVFLSGMNDGLVPLRRGGAAAGRMVDDEEERRLLFVGLTRARDRVEISYHAQPHEAGVLGELSPYLAWLPAALVEREDPPPVEVEPAVPVPASAFIDSEQRSAAPSIDPAAPFQPGQAVRHPRYGTGVVTRVEDGEVECDFGKRGARRFPLALCPLVAV